MNYAEELRKYQWQLPLKVLFKDLSWGQPFKLDKLMWVHPHSIYNGWTLSKVYVELVIKARDDCCPSRNSTISKNLIKVRDYTLGFAKLRKIGIVLIDVLFLPEDILL